MIFTMANKQMNRDVCLCTIVLVINAVGNDIFPRRFIWFYIRNFRRLNVCQHQFLHTPCHVDFSYCNFVVLSPAHAFLQLFPFIISPIYLQSISNGFLLLSSSLSSNANGEHCVHIVCCLFVCLFYENGFFLMHFLRLRSDSDVV